MIQKIHAAKERLSEYLKETPCTYSTSLSSYYKVFLKREEQQPIRSYKIRGALNAMLLAIQDYHRDEFICASAGNHAQGVAYSARLTNTHATIVMPKTTPSQKIEAVMHQGKNNIKTVLFGDNYDQAYQYAREIQNGHYFIHPFDDQSVIAGQGTTGLELKNLSLDAILVPIGGGGLAAGIASIFANSQTKVIGVQVESAPSMYDSLLKNAPVRLKEYSTFIDGACVSTPGINTFEILKELQTRVVLVSENEVCTALLDLYNKEGVVAELAGAMSVAALSKLPELGIKKDAKVCCIISGGNNDIRRIPQIIEKSIYASQQLN